MNTEQNRIIVSNIPIDVIRKEIKNLHLSVHPPTGRVRISAPFSTKDEAIRLFAISKISWIKKHQKGFESQERQTIREYITGESHYFKGKRYLLDVVYGEKPYRVEIKKINIITLFVPSNSTAAKREKIMTEWYRAKLKEEIPDLIGKWENTIGVEIKECRIKKMKTKWGSCNVDIGRIWLNLQLIKKPSHCLEYIVVHEMVHFIERHHDEKYVAIMDGFMPKWRDYKAELNNFPLGFEEWNH
jgi:hypothetical protein